MEYEFSAIEIDLMLVFTSRLNPDDYPHLGAKALIYKCKAMMSEYNAGNNDIRIKVK